MYVCTHALYGYVLVLCICVCMRGTLWGGLQHAEGVRVLHMCMCVYVCMYAYESPAYVYVCICMYVCV